MGRVGLGNDVSVDFRRESSTGGYDLIVGMDERGRGVILLCVLVEPESCWTV